LSGALKEVTARLLERETIEGDDVAQAVAAPRGDDAERRSANSPMREAPQPLFGTSLATDSSRSVTGISIAQLNFPLLKP
ncbi:MAG: hypothetical protein ABI728_06080, partial [Betaproteobacteria bacterium]